MQHVLDRIQGMAERYKYLLGARRRQHSITGAYQERIAKLLAQPLQRGADRRLRQTEPGGRARHAMFADQGLQDDEEIEVDFSDIHHGNKLHQ